jgi:hypothetical protein
MQSAENKAKRVWEKPVVTKLEFRETQAHSSFPSGDIATFDS